MERHSIDETQSSENVVDMSSTPVGASQTEKEDFLAEDEELRKLLVPDVHELHLTPLSAIESNFVAYYTLDFMKPGHDQYVYRHANGLCVIGLAPSHVAFKDKGGITAVDFNVGKSNRSEMKVTGKRKKGILDNVLLAAAAAKTKLLVRLHSETSPISQTEMNAQHFETNTALCKICTGDNSYMVRCCVKGSLLEVNDRLIRQPELLNTSADREGYIAIIMPKPADWLKVKASLVEVEHYKKLRHGLT